MFRVLFQARFVLFCVVLICQSISPAIAFCQPQKSTVSVDKDAEIAAQRTASRLEFIAAVLGIVVTAAVTCVGWRVTSAMNRRTLVLQESAEERLKLDTFISALPLLNGTNPQKAHPERDSLHSVSILFVLIELGYSDFALNMLGAMWPNRVSNCEQMAWVIDRLMRKGSEANREQAAAMLFDNAESLVLADDGGFCWPAYLDESRWDLAFNVETRELLVLALMRIAQARPATQWHRQHLIDLLASIEATAARELDDSIKGLASRACIPICEILLASSDCQLVLPRGARSSVSGIKSNMLETINNVTLDKVSDQGRGELETLTEWKNGVDVERTGHTRILGVVHGD